jgi:hypothetical protein
MGADCGLTTATEGCEARRQVMVVVCQKRGGFPTVRFYPPFDMLKGEFAAGNGRWPGAVAETPERERALTATDSESSTP